MRRLLSCIRSHWRGLAHPAALDADMAEEMRFHIEMDAERRVQQGIDPQEARRQAAAAFGGVEKYRGASLDALGFSWARGLAVDLKLGLRMLAKHPGLTGVAVFALALAIGASAAYLEFTHDLMRGTLPFQDADRIVGIQHWDLEAGEPEHRVTADFVAWRGALRSFEDVAAYRSLDRDLITPDGRAEPVRGVEISASAFRIARVPPLLGRPLVDDDERTGAPAVAVLGSDLWIARFAADPGVIGRTIRFGHESYAVVGVMPQGFGLPINHSLWVPLRLNQAFYPRRAGVATRLFARLAPGVDLRSAQAELDTLAARSAEAFPGTDRHLRPVVKPYVESVFSAVVDSRMQTIVFNSANLLFVGLLALCGANVATLVFARTVSRDVEISVRTALGASRGRIAGQLFGEALVLSALATAIGLSVGAYALKWVKQTIIAAEGEPLMFWWNDALSPPTLAYAVVLALFAALIVGVVPALKATGPRIQDRLKYASGASASGLKFGGVWTGVIIVQVGATVIFVAIVGLLGWNAYVTRGGDRQKRFPAPEYVSMRLMLDRTPGDAAETTDQIEADYRRRFRDSYREFARQLQAEPGVRDLAYGTRLPGMNGREMRLEIDGASVPSAAEAVTRIRTATVGVGFVEAFQAPILAGRTFTDADLAVKSHVAIVDQTFVRRVLSGQTAIGRSVREAGGDGQAPGPWMEIVGVVADLTDDANKLPADAVLYQPAAAEAVAPFYLAVHAAGNPSTLISRIRIVASDVDPALQLSEVLTLDNVREADLIALDFFARLLAGVSVVALILAAAGVYALMSFTVSRQTSEIGIRLALGARPGRIVWSTFSRALVQVGAGLAVGSAAAAALVAATASEVSATASPGVAVSTCLMATAVVAGITVLACARPVRRALLIRPTDALKCR